MISTKNMSIENINNIFVTALNMKNKKNNNNDIGFNNKMIQIATSSSIGNIASFNPYNNFIDDMTNMKLWTGNDIYPRLFSENN